MIEGVLMGSRMHREVQVRFRERSVQTCYSNVIRRHYPRYSTIRGNFQIVAIYKDFKEISSDNLSLHDTVKVTKENRRL